MLWLLKSTHICFSFDLVPLKPLSCPEIWPQSVTGGPLNSGYGGESVTLLRELEWKKFLWSTFPIHLWLSELHLLTDLLSLDRFGLRRLPDAPIAALLHLCHYKGKPALYNRRHKRYHAVMLIAAQFFIFEYYEGQMGIIKLITCENGRKKKKRPKLKCRFSEFNWTYLGILSGVHCQAKNPL